MEFDLTHNNPNNTQIVGPGVTYDVRSPGFTKKHTTISRGDGTVVAEIDWHTWSSSRLRMGGREMRVNDFMQRSGWMGVKRKFEVGQHTYKWKSYGSLLTLERDHAPVAELERKALRSSKLHISQDASDILDYLVVTMIIVWRLQRQRSSAAATGAAAGAGSA